MSWLSKIVTALGISFMGAALSGCMAMVRVSYSGGTPVDKEKAALIKPGITTLSDILAWFGPPDVIIEGTQKVLDYTQVHYDRTKDVDEWPMQIVTAPEGTVILAYWKGEGVSGSALVAEPFTQSKYMHLYHEIRADVYAIVLSKKEKTVVETFGEP